MALLETLAEDFSAGTVPASLTVSAGVTVVGGRLSIPCQVVGGNPQFLNARSTVGYTWTGSSLTVEVPTMPTGGTGFAQIWVMDASPADTVDRLGFELRTAANALDLIGQTGATYTPIGTTTTLTYSATTHRWLRIVHTGTNVVWSTSPDGLTWTAQRTLATPPTWTTETTLLASFEAYRTAGTNDALLIDNINLPPAAAAGRPRPLLRSSTAAVGRSYSF